MLYSPFPKLQWNHTYQGHVVKQHGTCNDTMLSEVERQIVWKERGRRRHDMKLNVTGKNAVSDNFDIPKKNRNNL